MLSSAFMTLTKVELLTTKNSPLLYTAKTSLVEAQSRVELVDKALRT